MNHLHPMEPKQYQRDFPYLLDGSLFSLTDQDATLTAAQSDAAALNYDEINHVLLINRSLTKPLEINCPDSKRLKIIVKRDAVVHFLIRNQTGSIELCLEQNATAHSYLITNAAFVSASALNAQIESNAVLKLFDIALSDSKHERISQIELLEHGAQLSYFGLHQLHGSAQKTNMLTVFHRGQNTKSAQAFRGIYAGFSQGTFLGKVVIDKDAGLSAARQLYKSVIVSDEAKAHVMPQLEINNHDISASHGASIGELDKGALFYLCSRGLSLKDASTLLLTSFTEDILTHIEMPPIKNVIGSAIADSLARSLREIA